MVQINQAFNAASLQIESGAAPGWAPARPALADLFRDAENEAPPLPTVAPTRVSTVHSLPPSLAGDGAVCRDAVRRARAAGRAGRARD